MSNPAPLSGDSLKLCLGEFPAGARTLPGDAFTSEDVFAWEKEHFFDQTWMCVGRTDDLAQPGDQKAVVVGSEAVLLIRGEDLEVRGFFNVCRHRGHELLACDGAVNRGVVRCPYHRWTYGLDGTFMGGPGLASQPGFDRHDPTHNLVQVRTAEWQGWLFVNVSGDAPDLDEHLGDLGFLLEPYEMARLIPGTQHDYEIAANWKVIAENYHECYHCSEIHPELCRVSSPGSGQDYEPSGLVIGGSMTLNEGADTMSLDGKSKGVPFRRLSGVQLRDVFYLQVWPNLLLSVHPDYVMTHLLEPLSAGRTRIVCSWLFPPETAELPDFDPSYAAEFWDLTNRQDWAACEGVQRGVASRAFRQGPLSDQELVVYQSIQLVARGYLDGGPPAPVPVRRSAAAS